MRADISAWCAALEEASIGASEEVQEAVSGLISALELEPSVSTNCYDVQVIVETMVDASSEAEAKAKAFLEIASECCKMRNWTIALRESAKVVNMR